MSTRRKARYFTLNCTNNSPDIAGNAQFCAIPQEQNPRYQVQLVRFSAVARGIHLTSRRAIWCNLVRLREGEKPDFPQFHGKRSILCNSTRAKSPISSAIRAVFRILTANSSYKPPRELVQFSAASRGRKARFSAVSRAIRPISLTIRGSYNFTKSTAFLYNLTGNCPLVSRIFLGGERQI